ncbi:class I SAM-dependent methyltransferase, partial [Thermodesulfobacteriota bacterium]
MDKNTSCYLCENTELINRPGKVRDNQALQVCQCKACGLVFLSSFAQIKDGFYEDSGMHSEQIDIQSWLSETAWDDNRRYDYLKALLPNRSLLDFGCGVGGFLIKARELVTSAHGIELESRLAQHFQAQGLTVFKSLSELNQHNQNRYDIITMFHVMEHLPDPKAILRELACLLTENGQIIVEVPNADDILLSLYNSKPFSEFTYW